MPLPEGERSIDAESLGMRTIRGAAMAALICAAILVPAVPGSALARREPVPGAPTPHAVVALIDTGINPYSDAFRDDSGLANVPPWKYIPGYPKGTPALRLHLDLPYEDALKADEDVWATVQRGKLYWIPGTRIAGAISFGDGGTNCPAVTEIPPGGSVQGDCKDHVILDDAGHGSMTASRAAGEGHSLAPTARIVEIEGLGAKSVQWAADQGWIDVQSNSWLSLVPAPVPQGTTNAFAYAAKRMLTLAASGNGTGYIAGGAPTPTQTLATSPPGVVLVGGHDNGKMTIWAGAPPHIVADAYAGFSAIYDSTEPMRPDPVACCTSAASPYAAGGATAIVMEARRLLGDRGAGTRDGLVACGPKGRIAKGPLADGVFTLDELKDVLLHTAQARPLEGRDDGLIHWAGDPRAPDHTEFGPGANPFCPGCTTTPIPWGPIPDAGGGAAYQLIGYGAINEFSVKEGFDVLAGKTDIPDRPAADAQYDLDQQFRDQWYAGRDDGGDVKLPSC